MCDEGGCCRSFAKVILIIVNIFFLLAGLLMLAFGIATVAAPDKIISFFTSYGANFSTVSAATGGDFYQIVKAAGIFMIILGGVVAIVALFGFFGACCDNNCLLITYAIILIIIVLAEVALIIFAAVYPKVFTNTESDLLYTYLKTNFQHDVIASQTGAIGNNSNLTDIGAQWAQLQFSLKCCGAYNYTDYQNFNWTAAMCGSTQCFPGIKQIVPTSCCIPNNPNVSPQNVLTGYQSPLACVTSATQSTTYTQGCANATYTQISAAITGAGTIAIGIAAGIVGLEIILIILAFIVCCMAGGTDKYV